MHVAYSILLDAEVCAIRQHAGGVLCDQQVSVALHPQSTAGCPTLKYPVTRHRRNRFASPSQLTTGMLKRSMYRRSCFRIATARDMALKLSLCCAAQRCCE